MPRHATPRHAWVSLLSLFTFLHSHSPPIVFHPPTSHQISTKTPLFCLSPLHYFCLAAHPDRRSHQLSPSPAAGSKLIALSIPFLMALCTLEIRRSGERLRLGVRGLRGGDVDAGGG